MVFLPIASCAALRLFNSLRRNFVSVVIRFLGLPLGDLPSYLFRNSVKKMMTIEQDALSFATETFCSLRFFFYFFAPNQIIRVLQHFNIRVLQHFDLITFFIL